VIQQWNLMNTRRGMRQHPYFCTVGDGRLFTLCGPEAQAADFNPWGGQERQQTGNCLVALGRQRSGGTRCGTKNALSGGTAGCFNNHLPHQLCG
jgi:hypothetical protein